MLKEIECIKVGYIQKEGFQSETRCTDGGSALLYTDDPSGISIPMPAAAQVSDEMALGQSIITASLRSPFDSLQIISNPTGRN